MIVFAALLWCCVSCYSRTAWSSRFQILPGFNFELIERASGHRKCQQNELYVHIDIAGVMKYLRSAAWLLWNRLTISKSSFFFNIYCLLLLEGAECAVLSFWLQDPNWKVQGVLGSWMAGSKESPESAFSFCIPFCRNSSKKICYWTRWDCLDFGHWCSKLGLKGGVSKMFQSALWSSKNTVFRQDLDISWPFVTTLWRVGSDDMTGQSPTAAPETRIRRLWEEVPELRTLNRWEKKPFLEKENYS